MRDSKSKLVPAPIPERILSNRANRQKGSLLATKLSKVMARMKGRFYRHHQARSGKRKT